MILKGMLVKNKKTPTFLLRILDHGDLHVII